MSCGLDRRCKIFSISSTKESQVIQSLFLPDLPIYNAAFINQGAEMILSGNRKHYYSYDLEAQKITRIPCIFSHHEEKDLKRLGSSDEFYGFASSTSGYLMIHDTKSK